MSRLRPVDPFAAPACELRYEPPASSRHKRTAADALTPPGAAAGLALPPPTDRESSAAPTPPPTKVFISAALADLFRGGSASAAVSASAAGRSATADAPPAAAAAGATGSPAAAAGARTADGCVESSSAAAPTRTTLGRSALSHIPAFPPHITLCFCRDGTEEELHEALAEEQRRFAGHFKKKHKASVRTASSVLQGGRGGNAAAAGLGMKNKGMNTGGYAKATI
eukprot:GHVU01182893.1.p1 GENE.GHVU01182893.1~~GHVU01182893.1.p1  ORF type:complete len:225 (+),score=39.50 GHVU01182893.1:390-1064(+)